MDQALIEGPLPGREDAELFVELGPRFAHEHRKHEVPRPPAFLVISDLN